MPIENAVGALAGEAVAVRAGGDGPHPAPEVRHPGPRASSPSGSSINPWHCLPEHRPLGNQSRARRRMYSELSRLRQEMNQMPHIEPTGDEVLE